MEVVFLSRSLVQPDIFVARLEPGISLIGTPADIRGLLLVVEVLSPSTARVDRGRKRELHQRARVHEYWIVDHEARLVERWRPSDVRPEIISRTLVWHPEGAAGPLEIDLPALFAEALGV